MDFTLKTYEKFLDSIKGKGYSFLTFADFLSSDKKKVIVLRHDVDKLPYNSLRFAELQYYRGIKGTYYFRSVPDSWDEEVIRGISEMGHEVGYHYEDITLVYERQKTEVEKQKWKNKEDFLKYLADQAIKNFSDNLERLRHIVPVRTICMHGSPLSRWDNRLLWKYYDYRNFGIVGEPYFDIDFKNVLYLTDTGRRWDGNSFSIRDKVGETGFSTVKIHSTTEIIEAFDKEVLNDRIMITFHPQRWTNRTFPWIKEIISQKIKNSVKYILIVAR